MHSLLQLGPVLLSLWAAGSESDGLFLAHVRTTEPLTAAEQQKTFHLPPGFEIQLVAAEPEIQKPVNLAFDSRGRIFASGSTEYPYAAPADRKGRDRITLLEDTDGDGRADKVVTFADGLNIPMGLYPYRNGLIAFSVPNIYYFEDTDGDDRADRREILYGPLDYTRDVHGLHNAFRRGFDGWLYACHGFANETTMRGTDGSEITMQSGNTYRVRLDGSRVEQFTWGQANPFGMAFDPLGDIFTADCHTKPITLLLRSGYTACFSKPHDGLGFVPNVIEHSHGSTAISGLAYATGDNFPPEYQGNIFVGNVLTSRVHRDSLVYHGSTVQGRKEPDLITTDDPWFRPVDLRMGPDGALYIADFYNRIIGHYEVPLNHPGRDRHRGRIWRVVYRGPEGDAPLPRTPDLSAASTDELIDQLSRPALSLRMRATDEITDRIGVAAVPALRQTLRHNAVSTARVQALWSLHRLGALEADELLSAADDTDRLVRVHCMRVLSEWSGWSTALAKGAISGLADRDSLVRRAAADAVARHPRLEQVRPLLDALHGTPERDVHLRHMIRIALRNHFRESEILRAWSAKDISETDTRVITSVLLAVSSEEGSDFLLRYLERHEGDIEWDRHKKYLAHISRNVPLDRFDSVVQTIREAVSSDTKFQVDAIESLAEGLDRRGAEPPPALRNWALDLSRQLLSPTEAEPDTPPEKVVATKLLWVTKLAEMFSLSKLREPLRDMLLTDSLAPDTRGRAARTLAGLQEDERVTVLAGLIAEEALPGPLREAACAVVADADPERASEILVAVARSTPAGMQVRLGKSLAASRVGAELLLEAIADGKASPRLLQHNLIHELLLAALPSQAARIERLTAELPMPDTETRRRLSASRDEHRSKARSPERGSKLFETHCAICHQIGGRGNVVGPQLTGIGNRGLERVLEDLLDPNRNIEATFNLTTYVLDDGRVVSGLFRRQEGEQIIVVDNRGKEIGIAAASVVRKQESKTSLMPEDLATQLPPDDLHDLVAFLLTERQNESPTITWRATRVDGAFRSEGVTVSDVDRDGKLDIVAGEVWYENPSWEMHEIQKPGDYGDGERAYSESFLCFSDDYNGDGWEDQLVVGFPGKACHWFENPRGAEGHWPRHLVWPSACNESPLYENLFGDGKRVLIMGWQPEGQSKQGQMAWFRPGRDPTKLWEMHAISEPSRPDREVPGTQRFSHGLGVGDLNGDDRKDVLCTGGWWEHPPEPDGKPWKFHAANLGDACAQMYAVDVDGDGLADVISSSAHRYGIWFHRQVPGSGGTEFELHDLFGDLVSQTHALRFEDIDGDGLRDLITGKRFWAHGPKGDPGSDEPAVLYWFEAERDKDGHLRFSPRLIHDDSGVGLEFDVLDFNGDGLLDVVTSNKLGVHLFEQERLRGPE